MAQTTFEERLDNILLAYRSYDFSNKQAIAKIKAAVLAELPEPMAPITDRYPMNTTAQISRELSEARISKHNELIKEITEKLK